MMNFEVGKFYIVDWGNKRINSGRTRVYVSEVTETSARLLFDNGQYVWANKVSGKDYNIVEILVDGQKPTKQLLNE